MISFKDNTITSVNHKKPSFLPTVIPYVEDFDYWKLCFDVLDENALRDFLQVHIRKNRTGGLFHTSNERMNIWGTDVYHTAGYTDNAGIHPLSMAETIKDIESYKWPEADQFDLEIFCERFDLLPVDYPCIMSIGWLPYFCTLLDLFGMEEGLVKIYTQPKLVECCVYKIEELVLSVARRALEARGTKADFFFCGDDFATQRSMMISPELWRKFFLPAYYRLISLVKSYDLRIWWHSCGAFREVLPDLVDIGIDVWEAVQFHLNGNEPFKLKRDFGSYLTFAGGISTQDVLPFGTPEDVRNTVRERYRILGTDGGYICGPDHSIHKNIPKENLWALFDEVKKIY